LIADFRFWISDLKKIAKKLEDKIRKSELGMRNAEVNCGIWDSISLSSGLVFSLWERLSPPAIASRSGEAGRESRSH
jgi:hypothetical protein